MFNVTTLGNESAEEINTQTAAKVLVSVIQMIQIPSAILYLLFVVMLIARRKQQLRSAFFDICISLGIADLGQIAISTVHRFIVSDGGAVYWSANARLYYRYTMLCTWNTGYSSQIGGVLILTFNRFLALTTPIYYKQIYSKVPVKSLAVQWLPGSIYLLLQLFHPGMRLQAVATNTTDAFNLGYALSDAGYRAMFSGFVVYETLVLAALLIFYTAMFVELFRQKRKRHRRFGVVLRATDVQPNDLIETVTAVDNVVDDVDVQRRTSAQAQIRWLTTRPETNAELHRIEKNLLAIGLVLSSAIAYYALNSLLWYISFKKEAPAWIRAYVTSDVNGVFEAYVTPLVDYVFGYSNPILLLVTSSHCRGVFCSFFGLDRLWSKRPKGHCHDESRWRQLRERLKLPVFKGPTTRC